MRCDAQVSFELTSEHECEVGGNGKVDGCCTVCCGLYDNGDISVIQRYDQLVATNVRAQYCFDGTLIFLCHLRMNSVYRLSEMAY